MRGQGRRSVRPKTPHRLRSPARLSSRGYPRGFRRGCPINGTPRQVIQPRGTESLERAPLPPQSRLTAIERAPRTTRSSSCNCPWTPPPGRIYGADLEGPGVSGDPPPSGWVLASSTRGFLASARIHDARALRDRTLDGDSTRSLSPAITHHPPGRPSDVR